MLQLLVRRQLDELALDQLAFARIDMAIGFGRGNQRLEHRLAVQFGLRRRQAVQRLRLCSGSVALLRLPIAIRLVGQHTQRGQAAVGQGLAAILACFLVAQQQAHGACCQRTAAGTGKQAAKTARALAGRAIWRLGLLLQKVLAGPEQLIEQATGIHGETP
ncbi:hypothetical protein D9M71_188110 [compost metagenome]